MRLAAILTSHDQAHTALTRRIWPAIKEALASRGQPLLLSVRTMTRSHEQNARLHATLRDISEQVEWAGSKRDVETWKRLLTAAWLRARGEPVEMLPAIDGCGVDVVFRHTSELTRAECAELIDYVQAWATTHGVRLGAPEDWA
ncbi:MAG: recombination protein NinB [Rhodocyclaceae bacterium]|nr:recombination protein NinB [Rhodocyclaceae bacterium]